MRTWETWSSLPVPCAMRGRHGNTRRFPTRRSPRRMPVATELTDMQTTLRGLGVLCSEMETATVFVVGGAVHARRVGSVLAVVRGL
jgi:uridine phosphorylase